MPRPFVRYAVYFCPRPHTSLAGFGRKWLGVDMETGAPVARRFTDVPDAIVAEPRRYGLHATLKAPMRLREDCPPDEFFRAVADLAQDLMPVTIAGLRLEKIGAFLALVPVFPDARANELAWRCVRELDSYRAELSDEEIARRCLATLKPQQRQMLFTWGYPFVGPEFRFHMTLTGALHPNELRKVRPLASQATVNLIADPVTIQDLCICGDPGGGRPFRLVHRFPVAGR